MAQVSPTKGNVAFTSAQYGWSFTLQSFARLYCDVHGVVLDSQVRGTGTAALLLHVRRVCLDAAVWQCMMEGSMCH